MVSPRIFRRRGSTSTGIDRKRVLVLVGILAIIGIVIGIVATQGSTTAPTPTSGGSGTPANAYFASFPPNICPLTDTPAAGGTAPRRPALAIKIGNEPSGARPQSGLNGADIVYDTPAEGGVMRYVAVYQCQDTSSIGPIRSVRYVDWHLIRQFLHPILAYANGIIPDVNSVQKSPWLESADLLTNAASAGQRITTRVAPDNLYTSTRQLYSMFPSATTPPPPVFEYDTAVPVGAKPIQSAEINFSGGTDVLWKWTGTDWSHYYSSGSGSSSPDVDALTNQQVTTDNIVIQIVHFRYGPYPESPGSTGDVESKTLGSGSGYILRNGTMTAVTWHRQSLVNPDTFTNAQGKPVKLAPGRTWIELLLNTTAKVPGALTFTPGS